MTKPMNPVAHLCNVPVYTIYQVQEAQLAAIKKTLEFMEVIFGKDEVLDAIDPEQILKEMKL